MTYSETIQRYRVVKREKDRSDPRRRAEATLNGCDPDAWSLVWSFNCEADAQQQLAQEIAQGAIVAAQLGFAGSFYEWAVIDGGQAVTVERTAFL